MSLPVPRTIFGVHSLMLYNRTTHIPYGPEFQILGNASISLSGELVDLSGGSSRYLWSVEDGLISAEMTIGVKELPNYVMEVFLGKAVTPVSAETTGNVGTIANQNGTSTVNATTGIASVSLQSGQSADLKFGKYIVEVASATTVNVYCSTDVDFNRGADEDFDDSTMKIVAAAITITGTGGTTDLDDFGLTFTGGSGTVAMTTGDTAIFYVRPINTGGFTVDIGAKLDTFPFFGAIAYAEKDSDGRLFEVEAYKCKAIGFPIAMAAKAFAEPEVTARIIRDSSLDKVLSIRAIDGDI